MKIISHFDKSDNDDDITTWKVQMVEFKLSPGDFSANISPDDGEDEMILLTSQFVK